MIKNQNHTTALCVPLAEAEKLRRLLREKNLIRNDFEIMKDKKFIYFPVKEISRELCSYKLIKKSFKLKTKKSFYYKDCLMLPKKLMKELPTSYDVVGKIILIKLPASLLRYSKEIGTALLESHKNIQTVCLINPVSGEFRTRYVEIIAGENQTLTTHIEYGLSFNVNIATTYFSPRLATERKRVAGLVKEGEVIVDLFTGVAPFAIMIARYAKPKIVYAIDKNKDAIRLAQQNVKQNHVLNLVEVIRADAKNIAKVISEKTNRIIMNLPFSAYDYFPVIFSITAKSCKIHYYDILQEKDFQVRINGLKKIAEIYNYQLSDVSIHKIKTYAPREFYIGIDITATKTPT